MTARESLNASMSSQPQPAEQSATKQFVQLFSDNSQRIYTYILTLVPNRTDAQEIFQEVSLVLWRRFSDFEPGSNFGAWACRVTYYKVLQWYERRRSRPVTFSDALVETIDNELFSMDDTFDAETGALADCLAKLSAKDREMIMLRYSDGGSPRRIAESLSRPIRSVYKALNRIRRDLLQCVIRTLALGELG